MFQRYPYLRISTINGFADIRSLRSHYLYVWAANDLRTKDQEKYEMLFNWGGFTYDYGTRYNHNLLNLMGVKYLISRIGDRDERFSVVIKGKIDQIVKNDRAFERSFLVDKVKVLNSFDEMENYLKFNNSDRFKEEIPFLKSDLFNIKDSAIRNRLLSSNYLVEQHHSKRTTDEQFLDIKDENNVGEKHLIIEPSEHTGSTRVLDFKPNQVTIEVQSQHPSILVLTQSYHRGWSVKVNGRSASLIPAYYAYLSVPVEKGKSIVEFTFNDPLFVSSSIVSITLLISLVPIIFLSWKKERMKNIIRVLKMKNQNPLQ